MFDLGMMELLVIGVVALIVVGPKDLPRMFRTVGQFTGKVKGMAREFSRAMNDAADETGVSGLNADLRKMTSARKLGLDAVGDAAKSMADWEPHPDEPEKPAAQPKPRGPETQRMTEERAAAAEKIRQKAAEAAIARKEREAAEAGKTAAETPPPETERSAAE